MKAKPIHLISLLVFISAVIVLLGILSRNEKMEQITALNTKQAAVTQTDSQVQTATKGAASTQTQELAEEVTQSAATLTHASMLQPIDTAMPTITNTLMPGVRATFTANSATLAVSTATPDITDPAIVEPTSTAPTSATDTPGPSVELTTTPVPTETEIFTPVDWTGNWTAFFGEEGGVLFRATLVVSRIGNTIVGLHSTQNFTGILSADGLSVIGTWINPPTSGSFYWSMVSENQFCGNTEKAFAYCAARSGGIRPDPCFCRPTTD